MCWPVGKFDVHCQKKNWLASRDASIVNSEDAEYERYVQYWRCVVLCLSLFCIVYTTVQSTNMCIVQGYAFVQFTSPFDARSACLGEDGK